MLEELVKITCLLLLLDAIAPGQGTTRTAAELSEPGIYYKSPNGFVKIQQTIMSGGGTKHAGKMLLPGLTPQMVWTFRGSEAALQILEHKPTFYVKQAPVVRNVPGHSERDVVIVRFDKKKKDHRELQVTSGGNMFTYKAGFSKERTQDISVTHVSDGVFSITPVEDLARGEYLLTFGGLGATGYDFGIRAEK